MREIDEAKDFKKDKRKIERSGRYAKAMKERFAPALIILANDGQLDASYHDHALHQNMEGLRECHILFDLLLVYQYIDDDVLRLERLSSHDDIFGL